MNVAYQLMDQLTAKWDVSVNTGGKLPNSAKGSSFEAALRDKTREVKEPRSSQDTQQSQGGAEAEKDQNVSSGKEPVEAKVVKTGKSAESVESTEEISTLDRLSLAMALMVQGQIPVEEPDFVAPPEGNVQASAVLTSVVEEAEPIAETELKPEVLPKRVRESRETTPLEAVEVSQATEVRPQEKQEVHQAEAPRVELTPEDTKSTEEPKVKLANRPQVQVEHRPEIQTATISARETSHLMKEVLVKNPEHRMSYQLEQVNRHPLENNPKREDTRTREFSEEKVEDDGTWQNEDATVTEYVQPLFKDLDAVPVRVAETPKGDSPIVSRSTTPVQLESPRAPGQIFAGLEQAAERGVSRVELTLVPESLGKLSVELTRRGDGSLSVVLTASTSKAAALLEQHSGHLHQLLAAKNPGEVHVEVRESGQQLRQQLLNPDGSDANAREQQRQRQQQQEEEERNRKHRPDEDFMQRLRLGLTGIA